MHLFDCFIEPVAYLTYEFEKLGMRQPHYDQFRRNLLKLLENGEKKMDRNRHTIQEYEEAKFAVCAWIDELIMQSTWKDKCRWQAELLQQRFFRTTGAGSEFFEKLDKLGGEMLEVREIYYLCLTFGFSGKFFSDGAHTTLDKLKSTNCKILTGLPSGVFSVFEETLFPNAYQGEIDNLKPERKSSKLSNMYSILGHLLPPGIFAFLYFLYRFILENELMKI